MYIIVLVVLVDVVRKWWSGVAGRNGAMESKHVIWGSSALIHARYYAKIATLFPWFKVQLDLWSNWSPSVKGYGNWNLQAKFIAQWWELTHKIYDNITNKCSFFFSIVIIYFVIIWNLRWSIECIRANISILDVHVQSNIAEDNFIRRNI